jgi:antitoxin component YwqK of YwqJK toxin-antitoxin module
VQELWDEDGNQIVRNGNGLLKEYYENGQMRVEVIYTDGIYQIQNWWDENGEQMIKDGTGYHIVKDDMGAIIYEGKYLNSEPDGKWKYYSGQGILISQVNYTDGKLNGESIYYSDSGEIYSKGNFINNERDGLWTWFSPSGRKESQVSFKNGEKEGEQLFWSPMTEKVIKKEYYKNGDLLENN